MTRTPLRRRLVRALGLVLAVPIVAAALVAASVWSEDRWPSAAADASALARVRGVLTRPVVDLIASVARARVRAACARRLEVMGISEDEAIARLADEDLPPHERALWAYRLARAGSPEAVAALAEALRVAPPDRRAFLVQLVGSTGDPSVAPQIGRLIDDPDPRVVAAAVRGLAALQGREAIPLLAALLVDDRRPTSVRIEAARGLGTTGAPEARAALAAALPELPHGDVAAQALRSLAKFPFPLVASHFERVLGSPDTPREVRAAAADALWASTAEAVPFLLGLAQGDRDPDVRASAAWALSAHEGPIELGPALADLVGRESDPDVRRRLYEAITGQRAIPAERLVDAVLAEHDVAARVAGCNAIGRAVGREPARAAAARYDAEVVPEMARIASSPNSVNVRVRAVFALRLGRTGAADRALADLAGTECPQVAAAASRGKRAME